MADIRWDTGELLDWVEGKASERKFRLFAVACCRSIWPLITDEACREAAQLAERFADQNADLESMRAAWNMAEAARRIAWGHVSFVEVNGIRYHARKEEVLLYHLTALASAVTREGMNARYARDAADAALATVWTSAIPSHLWSTGAGDRAAEQAVGEESLRQVCLIRCIFGNPFRPVSLDSSWMPWNDACVPKITQAIYNERRFHEISILADALEEAGCNNEAILRHCREPGEHVRGCWVIDLLLGKQ